jgi:DnaK suppressor protein
MPAKKEKTAKAPAKKKTPRAARKKTTPKPVKKKAAKKKAPKAAKKKAALKPARKGTARKKAVPKAARKKAVRKKVAPRAARPKEAGRKPAAKAKPLQGEKEAAETRQESLRRLLVQKREQIVREAQEEIAKYIKGENRQLVETALDDGDWSVIDLSEDVNLRKLGTHRETLLKIDEALRKLSEGTYGKCEDCGDEISAERLRVLPFAIYCRDCQEAREELEAFREERSI